MRPLLILKAGSTSPELIAAYGDFDDWVGGVIGESARPVMTIDARSDSSLPQPKAFAGVVITGSHSMVTDGEPWSEALVPWLRLAVDQGVPIFGICYGHQLLAHALGGSVGFHPAGIEIGTATISTTEWAASDPLFGSTPSSFQGHTVHRQTVIRLPESAVCLARNTHEPHHAFRIGACAWGVQFHPEFDADAMRGYLQISRDDLKAEGVDAEGIAGRVVETPHARALLMRFCGFLAG